jgi:hypothetical protein
MQQRRRAFPRLHRFTAPPLHQTYTSAGFGHWRCRHSDRIHRVAHPRLHGTIARRQKPALLLQLLLAPLARALHAIEPWQVLCLEQRACTRHLCSCAGGSGC